MSKLSSPALIAKLAALCVLVIAASSGVFASPVGVSYTVSGSAGAWTLDFSVTNNVNSGQVVYIFGVLLPDQGIVNGPTGWNNRVTIATGSIWNPAVDGGLGGPNLNYNNLWHLPSVLSNASEAIGFGDTISSFEVQLDTIAAPTSVQWFAYGVDITPNATSPYTGGGEVMYGPESACENVAGVSCSVQDEFNPLFAGTVYEAGATPEPSSLLLLGTGLLGLGPLLRRKYQPSSATRVKQS